MLQGKDVVHTGVKPDSGKLFGPVVVKTKEKLVTALMNQARIDTGLDSDAFTLWNLKFYNKSDTEVVASADIWLDDSGNKDRLSEFKTMSLDTEENWHNEFGKLILYNKKNRTTAERSYSWRDRVLILACSRVLEDKPFSSLVEDDWVVIPPWGRDEPNKIRIVVPQTEPERSKYAIEVMERANWMPSGYCSNVGAITRESNEDRGKAISPSWDWHRTDYYIIGEQDV